MQWPRQWQAQGHVLFLPLQSPLDRAQAAKNKGNKYFKAGKYENAIQCYTEAIALCPTEQKTDLSTFYQNRAAAYEQQVSKICVYVILVIFLCISKGLPEEGSAEANKMFNLFSIKPINWLANNL